MADAIFAPDQKAAAAQARADLCYDDFVTDNPDGTRTVRLEFPFERQEKKSGDRDFQAIKVDAINLRRPKAGDLDLLERITDNNTMGPTRDLVAELTKGAGDEMASDYLAKNIDAIDMQRLMMAATDFFTPAPSPKTGDGSLPTS